LIHLWLRHTFMSISNSQQLAQKGPRLSIPFVPLSVSTHNSTSTTDSTSSHVASQDARENPPLRVESWGYDFRLKLETPSKELVEKLTRLKEESKMRGEGPNGEGLGTVVICHSVSHHIVLSKLERLDELTICLYRWEDSLYFTHYHKRSIRPSSEESSLPELLSKVASTFWDLWDSIKGFEEILESVLQLSYSVRSSRSYPDSEGDVADDFEMGDSLEECFLFLTERETLCCRSSRRRRQPRPRFSICYPFYNRLDSLDRLDLNVCSCETFSRTSRSRITRSSLSLRFLLVFSFDLVFTLLLEHDSSSRSTRTNPDLAITHETSLRGALPRLFRRSLREPHPYQLPRSSQLVEILFQSPHSGIIRKHDYRRDRRETSGG